MTPNRHNTKIFLFIAALIQQLFGQFNHFTASHNHRFKKYSNTHLVHPNNSLTRSSFNHRCGVVPHISGTKSFTQLSSIHIFAHGLIAIDFCFVFSERWSFAVLDTCWCADHAERWWSLPGPYLIRQDMAITIKILKRRSNML